MTLLMIVVGIVAILALAVGLEAYIRRDRPRKRLIEHRPEMPAAKSNLGFGLETEWRPKSQDSQK